MADDKINQYLQETVMGECWHRWDRVGMWDQCVKCLVGFNIDQEWDKRVKANRDFCTPTDYCALEDKMRELGEWEKFHVWLWKKQTGGLKSIFSVMERFHTNTPRAQRSELIAEYFRSKGDAST
jgi:hypothetical protein